MVHADTAWVMTSAALVLLMTPGLAFFYGGMVRVKSVLNMLMMSFITIAVVTVLWVLYGYSFAFGGSDTRLFGGFDNFGLHGLSGGPVLSFVAFQLMFAIITPALISGAIADRAKFGAWVAFMAVWTTIVYFPVANWVFDFGYAGDAGAGAGWLVHWGVQDFAGGTAVHVNAGAAALAVCLVLGRRIGWRKDPMRPHNVPFVLLGAALLWFGWFGFNAGSALAANGLAASAFVNTQAATAAAVCGWLVVERIRDGKPTTLGAASGAVAGLVAITPACGFVSPIGSLIIGVLAGGLCALAVGMKWRFGFDDSLDVVGIHLVGGAFGSIALGFLSLTGGLLYADRDAALLGKQTVAVLTVGAYSFVLAYVIAWVVDRVIGFRVDEDDEVSGIDLAEHAETGYELHPSTGSGVRTAASIARPANATEEESVNA
ncbi:MAG TPA: ammonium transporter [Nocardioidaceae bacterium]|nr:ammonium transporter [Nocardioidaceae bacterium]